MAKKTISLRDLSRAQQNYVEAIAELSEEHGHAHPAEIARALKVKKPSVTEAVKRLVSMGVAKRSGAATLLTPHGARIAGDLAYRHETLRRFMVDILEMDAREADSVACEVEHSASSSFVDRILALENFMQEKASATIKKRWRDYVRKQT